jgi:hypothetical protein
LVGEENLDTIHKQLLEALAFLPDGPVKGAINTLAAYHIADMKRSDANLASLERRLTRQF